MQKTFFHFLPYAGRPITQASDELMYLDASIRRREAELIGLKRQLSRDTETLLNTVKADWNEEEISIARIECSEANRARLPNERPRHKPPQK